MPQFIYSKWYLQVVLSVAIIGGLVIGVAIWLVIKHCKKGQIGSTSPRISNVQRQHKISSKCVACISAK